MRIGFCLPQFGPLAEPPQVARFAREAEALGADSLWVGDRLLAPVSPSAGHAGGDSIPVQFRASLDPFAALTMAAAVTSRTLLGTSVINVPWYPPALLARSLTTIDVLSGGRLIAGFGTGWSPEEFQAAGVPLTERDERLDESLDILHALWADGRVEHQGKRWTIPPAYIDLKPVQRPRPPVYLGGHPPAVLDRIARRADGWLPSVRVPGPFDPLTIGRPLARIREAAERLGRDPAHLGAIVRINVSPGATSADITALIAAAGQVIGIDHVFADLMYVAGDIDQALDIVDRVLEQARDE